MVKHQTSDYKERKDAQKAQARKAGMPQNATEFSVERTKPDIPDILPLISSDFLWYRAKNSLFFRCF